MVHITELMEHATRRQVEDIAKRMGFAKADEYPDEVLQAVKEFSATNKRSPSAKAEAAGNQASAAEAEDDLKYVQAAAENRAAGMLIALDSLTMMHCATRQFSDPKLQTAVDESRQRLKQMLSGVAGYYSPERFLAQTPLLNGGNLSTRSLNGSRQQSNGHELSAVETDS